MCGHGGMYADMSCVYVHRAREVVHACAYVLCMCALFVGGMYTCMYACGFCTYAFPYAHVLPCPLHVWACALCRGVCARVCICSMHSMHMDACTHACICLHPCDGSESLAPSWPSPLLPIPHRVHASVLRLPPPGRPVLRPLLTILSPAPHSAQQGEVLPDA